MKLYWHRWFIHRKNKLLFFVINCFVVHWIIRAVLVKRVEMNLSKLQANVLSFKSAGGHLCKSFSCFGRDMCDVKGLKVTFDRDQVTEYNDWIKLGSMLEDKYHRIQHVAINIPFISDCQKERCSIPISKQWLTKSNQKAWICRKMGFKKACNVINTLNKWPHMMKIQQSTGRLNPNLIRGLSPPLTCVSTRLADRVLRRVIGMTKGSILLKDYTPDEKAKLLFTCKFSPSTLIQWLFPRDEGWGLPKHRGTCGLVTIYKAQVIKTLFEIYDQPWKIRLDVAIQLLDLAHFFTENDSKFMLLFHHLTPHDIGITTKGKLMIQHTDNLVVVDTTDPNQKYANKFVETPYHQSKLPHIKDELLCQQKNTDINYYIVCRYFLGGSWEGKDGLVLENGLLHDQEELTNYVIEMSVLLDICMRGSAAVPTDHHEDVKSNNVRQLAAKQLRRLLALKRPCGPGYKYRYPECELIDEGAGYNKLPNFEFKRLIH